MHHKFSQHAVDRLADAIGRQPSHTELDIIYDSIRNGAAREIARGRGRKNEPGVKGYEFYCQGFQFKACYHAKADKVITIIGRREKASGRFKLSQIVEPQEKK